MTALLIHIYTFDWVPAPVWVLLAWLAVAVVLGVLIGRTIHHRDHRETPDA